MELLEGGIAEEVLPIHERSDNELAVVEVLYRLPVEGVVLELVLDILELFALHYIFYIYHHLNPIFLSDSSSSIT